MIQCVIDYLANDFFADSEFKDDIPELAAWAYLHCHSAFEVTPGKNDVQADEHPDIPDISIVYGSCTYKSEDAKENQMQHLNKCYILTCGEHKSKNWEPVSQLFWYS